jgi:hypothetical protein
MFRIYPITSRSLLRSPNALFSGRLSYATHAVRPKRKGSKKFDFRQLSEVPKTAEGLSKHLDNAYTSPGALGRAQADNRRVNIVSRDLCGE